MYVSVYDTYWCVELARRSCSVMDCHVTTRGSIPGGNGVNTELHVLRKGQCRLQRTSLLRGRKPQPNNQLIHDLIDDFIWFCS